MASKGTRGRIRPRILIAHRDHEWVDRAKSRLESMGYLVNECFELDWVPDILNGSIPYDLALISSEMDPGGQASVLDLLKKKGCPTKVVLLLDDLDGPTMQVRSQTGMLTHRLSQGTDELAALVVAQIGPPPEPKPV